MQGMIYGFGMVMYVEAPESFGMCIKVREYGVVVGEMLGCRWGIAVVDCVVRVCTV